MLITPAKKSQGYQLLIEEDGTHETSLIQLAADGLINPTG